MSNGKSGAVVSRMQRLTGRRMLIVAVFGALAGAVLVGGSPAGASTVAGRITASRYRRSGPARPSSAQSAC